MPAGTDVGNWNDPPWHPMKSPSDIKTVGKALEEMGELVECTGRCVAAAARCLIQGIDEVEPVTKKPNRQWLEEEIADVELNLELLKKKFGLDTLTPRKDRKRPLLEDWHKGA